MLPSQEALRRRGSPPSRSRESQPGAHLAPSFARISTIAAADGTTTLRHFGVIDRGAQSRARCFGVVGPTAQDMLEMAGVRVTENRSDSSGSTEAMVRATWQIGEAGAIPAASTYCVTNLLLAAHLPVES